MDTDAAIKAALDLMQANINALNARDEAALAATFHFPHYRLCDGVMQVWETPDDYFKDFQARAGGEWAYSKWGSIDILQAGADKVHLAIRVERYREDDSLITAFNSLWIISEIDGTWAAQARSTFAGD